MKGIILAGGRGSRLFPITIATSKQLLPCFDKPLIYYPLSVLMLAEISEIAIITNPDDLNSFKRLLGDGSQFGCKFEYFVQDKPRGIPEAYILTEKFIASDPSCLILGDNVFLGNGVGTALANLKNKNGATIFAQQVKNPNDFGVIEFDKDKNILSIVEKPIAPKSDLAVTGIYFTDSTVIARAKSLTPSSRGELEMVDILNSYLNEKMLNAMRLERSTVWFDTGTPLSLFHASEYVKVVQEHQNTLLCSPEEIAWRAGWINDSLLLNLAETKTSGYYRNYLKNLCKN